MARNLSETSLAKLAQNLGTEPIVIIEIQWVDGGPRVAYSDRDIAGGIKGAILEVSGLDDVVQVSGGGQSQQISFTLDDTDGSLKAMMDSLDMHKRPCWVYQWFDGIPVEDKFLIFKGALNSPIVWDEGSRHMRFDVISKIEDVEVGFSIEEGDFINPPEELIGKPWPLCFGTVINVPALRTTSTKRGVLAQGTGIRDFTLERRLKAARGLICPLNFEGYRVKTLQGSYLSTIIEPVYTEDPGCQKAKCEAIETLQLQLQEQRQFEINPVRIYGGEKFPQNTTITLNINGGKFTGKFNGDIFTITGRLHPDNDGAGNVVVSPTQQTIESQCGRDAPPAGSQEDLSPNGEPGITPTLRAKDSKDSFDRYNAIPASSFFWANAGSAVTIDSDENIIYIANLLPSTILRVAAFRNLPSGRQLLTVPESYYTIRETDYTGYPGVMEIVFNRPLSTRDLANGGGWSDDIYVTLTSSVGPNTVDILKWFIATYTDYSVDDTSFDEVRELIDNYPMHFPLLVRKNIINVLEEIAFQARCALWLKDDVFYIKYLAADPTPDGTITEDDVLPNSLRIEHTRTEDLVTKYVAKWRKDYAISDPNTTIFRRNVKKYGTHEKTYDFYCFNIIELVRKAATFWLIRKSNTWRRAILKTPINKLNLESLDTAAVTLPDVADGTVKCIVELANYNSEDKTIDFELWTPCLAGTRVANEFAFPADIEELTLFPTLEERELGYAGSGNEPNFSVIAPKNHPLSNGTEGLFQGFSLACNGGPVQSLASGTCRPDFGDKHPSDRGDVKPTPDASVDQAGEINTGTSPITTGIGGGGGGSCCKDAMDKANQALQEAQQARREAQEAGKKAGQEESEEKDLDDAKNDLPPSCGGNCSASVRITKIIPDTIVFPPGSENTFGSNPGDMGNLVSGAQTTQECFTFNSATAAAAFAAEIQAQIDSRGLNYGWQVGKEDYWLINSISTDLGTDTNPDSPTFGQQCPEPGGEDQAMTGYTSTPV
jgi:hypothetical protein